MKTLLLALLISSGSICLADQIPNPLINYPAFQKIVVTAASERPTHRLTEAQFIAAMANKTAVILDARSANKYELRHIRGAVSLPFTEFTADTLAKVIPDKGTEVLIYCNNNFIGSPISFASKAPAASLNISTFTSLMIYGYTNIFELGPLLNVQTTAIPFEGTELKRNSP